MNNNKQQSSKMSEADFYPAGAYLDPRAPYNQPVIPERDFDLTISQSLSKDVTVCTDNYIPEFDDEDGHTYANTEDTDWNDVYSEEHLTPLQLIEKFKSLLMDIDSPELRMNPCVQHKQYYINECSGWTNDETEIVEN